jgi:hypothetical protein
LDLPFDADVGFGVGLGVAFGVGLGVGLAVGVGVARAVGAAVGAPVAAGWLGRVVDGAPGAAVGLPGATGDAEAAATVGLGLASVPDAVGDGDGAGGDPEGVAAGVSLAGGRGEVPDVGVEPSVGVAVGTIAIALGPLLAPARCWSSNPPMPSATVARTRFRTPRLTMSRVR